MYKFTIIHIHNANVLRRLHFDYITKRKKPKALKEILQAKGKQSNM